MTHPLATAPAPRPEDGPLLAQVLDALAYPLFVLRTDGSLLHANRAGLEALAPGGPLHRVGHGHLLPRDAELKPAFHAAMHAAAAGRALALHGTDGALLASLTPLAVARTDAAPAVPAEPARVVLLAWALPGHGHGAADVLELSRRYQLTDAEARVLEQLLAGHGAEQAAQAIGVSLSTVRSQILSLRRKTGHRSVPALLASLRALPALAPKPLTGRPG